MNSRKTVGVISLIFAWIFIRFSHEDTSGPDHLPYVLVLINFILCGFGILQLILGIVLEDLPAIGKRIHSTPIDFPDDSENH